MGSCWGRHRLPGAYMRHFSFPKVIKKPLFPLVGTRTEKTISAVPPCLPEIRPLCTAPTRRLPVNAGNASEDTPVNPFPSALGGPFAAPLFALLSAMQNSLWMRLAALLPLRWFQFMLRHLYIICVRLSRTFFVWRGLFSQYSRTTALTTPMISALVPSMGL